MVTRYAAAIAAVGALLAGCAVRENQSTLPGTMPQSVATSSSYKVLYAFRNHANPDTNLIDVKGTLYGTTPFGGSHNGMVYSITAAGTEKTLHKFRAGSDGAHPQGSLIEVNGTLYGTTFTGGNSGCEHAEGCGTVYSISPNGTEKVLYAFAGGADGAHPMGSLVDVGGMFYGTTYQGGGADCSVHGRASLGCGTVFSVSTSGTEKVLYAFAGRSDGWFPKAGLIDVKGKLYGTTYLGGFDAEGTVFRITTSGVKKILHAFGAGTDGANPEAPLIDVNGMLYGTTYYGGATDHGTVFGMRTDGAEQVLYSFAGTSDGGGPAARLLNVNGMLYGTTSKGGAFSSGTVYNISASGSEQVIHSFSGGPDGAFPEAGLIDVNGTLYGTTASDGTVRGGFGTVYALSP